MHAVRRKRLIKDLFIVTVSIAFAAYIGESALIAGLFGIAENHLIISAFIGGLFFTSVFTTVPALVFLAKLAIVSDPLTVALVGAVGSMTGDLIIFRFIRDHLREDLAILVSTRTKMRFHHLFEYRFFRWSMAVIGALIISSPLPDEIGLALMGMARMPMAFFLPVSFLFNAIGIFLVGQIAHSIVG